MAKIRDKSPLSATGVSYVPVCGGRGGTVRRPWYFKDSSPTPKGFAGTYLHFELGSKPQGWAKTVTGFLSLTDCSVNTSNSKHIRAQQTPPIPARGLTPKDGFLGVAGPWSNACVVFLKEGCIPHVPVPDTVSSGVSTPVGLGG